MAARNAAVGAVALRKGLADSAFRVHLGARVWRSW